MSWQAIRFRLFRLLGVLRSSNDLLAITWVLVAVDCLFIGNYAVTRAMRAMEIDPGLLGRDEFRITSDGGYPEIFNYAKLLLIVVLLGRMAASSRQLVYLALTCVWGLILLDDSLGIHESGGEFFVDKLSLDPVLGLRNQDLGELLTWGVLGAFVVPMLFLGFRRSDRAHVETGIVLLLPLAALVVFAVAVDMLYHTFSDSFPGAGLLIDSLEDGGEMISISVACALTLAARRLQAAGRLVSDDEPSR